MQDGLCARLLLAMPEPKPVTWTDEIVDPQIEQQVTEVFTRLLDLEPAADEFGYSEPYPLDLSPEAMPVWIEYFNRHRAELANPDDDLAAAWSKLEAYSARFALIFQLVAWAAGDASAGSAISESSISAGIELSDWFGLEARRVYGLFSESEEEEEQRNLIEWVRRHGGRTTASNLQSHNRTYRASGLANAALNGLVKTGVAHREIVDTKGRQRTDFVLIADSGDNDK